MYDERKLSSNQRHMKVLYTQNGNKLNKTFTAESQTNEITTEIDK